MVDDDPFVLGSCRVVFDAEGMEAVLAASAQDAFSLIEKERYDLALVDVKMPGMDGMEFLRRVRRRPEPFPVILMTGYATQDTLDAAAKEGAALVLPKPFTPDELLNAVQGVLPPAGQATSHGPPKGGDLTD
ncbi:response regulator [Desulfacinum hydrothermale]|uniref:response regulator n=1 Tax=Desulfacinum hydrothermale TaxID=109258 RepID=UPI001483332A|nr:response regulator [Desulfacinum hydrothermale]